MVLVHVLPSDVCSGGGGVPGGGVPGGLRAVSAAVDWLAAGVRTVAVRLVRGAGILS